MQDLLARADASALPRFTILLLFGFSTVCAARGVLAGIETARPFLVLGSWLGAMAGAITLLVSYPAFVARLHPLISVSAIEAFVREHEVWLAAFLAIGALAAVAVEFTRATPRSPSAMARAEAIGAAGESLVALALRDAGYPVLNNVLLRGRGWSTEIDHIVRTGGSLVAIETKTLAGRIEGWPEDRKWVQLLGGRERWFLNPLRQNATYLEVMRRAIGRTDVPLRGLVVVAGTATIGEALRGCVVPVPELRGVLGQDDWSDPRALDTAWAVFERAAS